MVTPSQQHRATLADLTRLYKENRIAECRAALKQIQDDQPDFFQKLLWIGQISENYDEANHAAELALAIKPTDEIAQRVIVRVQERFPQQVDHTQIDVMRLTGMTINQARAVRWPFRGVNRPVGNLLDEKIIKINDLAFAADNAYDATLKKAATTLLLDYLLQGRTAQPPAPITLLKGSSFAGRQVKLNALWAGIASGASMALALLFFVVTLFNLVSDIAKFVGLLIFIILTPIVTRFTDKRTELMLNSERGRDAENKVVDIFRASLQNPWVLVQNLVWPNRKWGDIDLVLAGPGGIWVFEVKAYSSHPIRNIGDRWQYKTRLGWFKLSKHPGMQARRNAVTLKEYLNQNGVQVGWVQPVIIWADTESAFTSEDPAVPIWRLDEIENHLDEFWRQSKLQEDDLPKVKQILDKIVKQSLSQKK